MNCQHSLRAQRPGRLTRLLLVLALGLGACEARAQWSLITGAEYSSGTYGSKSRTDVASIPFAVRYVKGPWTAKLASSWLQITGDGSVTPFLGSTSAGSSPSGSTASLANSGIVRSRTTDAGFGDLVLSGIYNVFDDERLGRSLDLGGSVKFGTADAHRGLGTGYNDYALKASLFQDFGPRTVFITLGHKVIGTAPGTQARSQHFGALGLSHRLNKNHSFGAAIDFASASRQGGDKPLEASVFYRYRFNSGTRLNVELARGFSDASPSIAAALSLTFALD